MTPEPRYLCAVRIFSLSLAALSSTALMLGACSSDSSGGTGAGASAGSGSGGAVSGGGSGASVDSGGSGGEAANPAPSAATREEFEASMFAAWCAGLTPCCTEGPYEARADCPAILAQQDARLPGLGGEGEYFPESGAACLAAIKLGEGRCSGLVFNGAPYWPGDVRVCQEVHRTGNYRSREPAEQCKLDSDCVVPAGAYTATCFSSRCNVEVRIPQGEICAGPGFHSGPGVTAQCGPKLACTGNVCQPPSQGFTCKGSIDCDPGFRCSVGACVVNEPLPALGEACTGECAEGYCGGDKVCTPRLPPGKSCKSTDSAPCASGRCDEGLCVAVDSLLPYCR